jgi:hypothetical protein
MGHGDSRLIQIKWFTVLKGVLWELLGVGSLFVWAAYTTDFGTAGRIAIGYPLLRMVMYYPFERLFKRFKHKYQERNGV